MWKIQIRCLGEKDPDKWLDYEFNFSTYGAALERVNHLKETNAGFGDDYRILRQIHLSEPTNWVRYDDGSIHTDSPYTQEIVIVLPNNGSYEDLVEAVKHYLEGKN
jgi:hypothetical protein